MTRLSQWCQTGLFVALIAVVGCRSNEVAPAEQATSTASVSASQPATPVTSSTADTMATPKTKAAKPPRSEQWKKGKAARNPLPIGRYVVDRLDWLDKRVRFRAHAEAGDYYNCHYKGQKSSVRHVRLRGDGSAYLDAYLPRDKAGEKLWIALKKNASIKVTATVVMRSETVSDICTTQVDLIDHTVGWSDDELPLASAGALEQRISNARDTAPVHNRPTIAAFQSNRLNYVDKTVLFRVRARLDRYYQCRYASAERTHYAISLGGDGFVGLRGYIARNEKGKALAELLSFDEGARLTVSVTIPQGRYDELCEDQVEILDWKKGWNAGKASIP